MFEYYKPLSKTFGLLNLLFAVAIVLVLGYMALNTYFLKPDINSKLEKELTRQGIDASNYSSIVKTTREKIDDLSKQYEERLQHSYEEQE